MSFDAVFRHLRGQGAAAAAAPAAPARTSTKSDDVAAAIGVAALVGLIGALVYSRQRREDQIERLEEEAADELEELEQKARVEAVVPVSALAGYSPERDERHRHYAEASTWGRAFPLRHNPPAWVHDEPTWERAKAAVLPRWNDYAEPWAVVAHVYHAMGGR